MGKKRPPEEVRSGTCSDAPILRAATSDRLHLHPIIPPLWGRSLSLPHPPVLLVPGSSGGGTHTSCPASPPLGGRGRRASGVLQARTRQEAENHPTSLRAPGLQMPLYRSHTVPIIACPSPQIFLVRVGRDQGSPLSPQLTDVASDPRGLGNNGRSHLA